MWIRRYIYYCKSLLNELQGLSRAVYSLLMAFSYFYRQDVEITIQV